jgi:hypothetical protein
LFEKELVFLDGVSEMIGADDVVLFNGLLGVITE